MFIEFRGHILDRLESFKNGDKVQIVVQFKGSVSRKSGIKFNNLIAKSIQHLNTGF